MTRRQFLRASLLAALLMLAGFAAAPPYAHTASRESRRLHTPPPGSEERRAILDAMRLKIKELHGLDVVFVVKEMHVSGGWAWVHTMPRSKDGYSSYEDFYALLRNVNARWRIAEIPCTEPENPECIDSPGYFKRLARRFPGVPASIFRECASDR
jgi:hypothetical protein